MRWPRRRILLAAIAGGGVALLRWAGAIAQGSGTGLLRATKQALVMGNSRYPHAPLLAGARRRVAGGSQAEDARRGVKVLS